MNLPSIENLRCFEAAASARTFREAARRVALTPAAFGQRIKQLEEQLGAPLFARTTRSVALTQAGLAMVPRVRDLLEAAAALTRTTQTNAPAPMRITLGTRHELGLSFLLPLHDAVLAAHAGLSVDYFVAGSGTELLLRVRSREIDCAITSSRLTDPLLDSARMHREDYVFVGAPKLLARQPLARDEQAANHTLIDIGSDLPLFRYWRDAPHGGDRLRFGQLWQLGSIEFIKRAVLEGRGVAVLPAYFVARELSRKQLRPLFPHVHPLFDYFRLVFRRDDPRRSAFEALAATYAAQPLR